MNMPRIDLNWLAVIAATLSAFVLGGLWYGPLFKNARCREAGIDPGVQSDRAPPHPARIFAIAFVCSLPSALIFAVLLGTEANAADGVGLFFVAMSFGINYAFHAAQPEAVDDRQRLSCSSPCTA